MIKIIIENDKVDIDAVATLEERKLLLSIAKALCEECKEGADYENGSSIKDLQEKYNITREYVYVLLKKYGIEIRKVRKVE